MTPEKTTIALTGATGFIGRSVLAQLKARGYAVNALCRRIHKDETGVSYVQGDLDAKAALGQIAAKADTFIHIAGLTKARTLKQLLAVNETGAANAARAAREAGVRRFVLVSSLAARAPHLSPYARSKRAGEDAVRAVINAAGNMELVIVRPPAIIGPGDEATAPMLNILRRGFLPAPGGKTRQQARMSFIYMDDIARFLIEQIDAPLSHSVIAPYGGTRETGWQELADTAASVLSKPVRVIPVPPLALAFSALLSQTVSALFLRSGFFNTGKVRELLHSDWTGETEIKNALTLDEALKLSFGMDINL